MGDRAMAELKTKRGSLFFYTHSCGYALPKHARCAVDSAKGRKGDTDYALKIIVDQLIKLCHARDSEVGAGLMFGPSAEDQYNDNCPSVIVDVDAMTVESIGRQRH
jgi:hypothetical protein